MNTKKIEILDILIFILLFFKIINFLTAQVDIRGCK